MARRSVLRVLLSPLSWLVLLLSQQMAMSHALNHWTSRLGGPIAQDTVTQSELSSAFAQDRGCAQCLVLAQLAAPLAGKPREFVPPGMADVLDMVAVTQAGRTRQARAFDSRAPPVPG